LILIDIIGDKIGLRLAGLIFVSLTLAGVVIVAIAPSFSNAFIVMAIGRTVFGYALYNIQILLLKVVKKFKYEKNARTNNFETQYDAVKLISFAINTIILYSEYVFSMGAESLNTIQIAMVARWFNGGEMGKCGISIVYESIRT
jgi:MFS family permease